MILSLQTAYSCPSAALTSMTALPAPNPVWSMIALNGPFPGRFAMRRRRSLSALLILDREGAASFVERENTAGMADRWESTFVAVSSALEYRSNVLRTMRFHTCLQGMFLVRT
ncbi:hypothetical protein M405DRAFT_68084 [Rhizopogon salebrosus TDB-379]|nr:hypothetical protein M405DRAFT_68084 [Rhizopogon salebrosus TDB-379]